MAFNKWIFLLRRFRFCSNVNSTSCIDFSSVALGISERVRQSNVQYNTILCIKEHYINSWALYTSDYGDTNLLLYDRLCSNSLTIFFALFDMFSNVILWWVNWPFYWERYNGLERHSSCYTDLFVANDCFFRIFQESFWFTLMVWMAGIHFSK